MDEKGPESLSALPDVFALSPRCPNCLAPGASARFAKQAEDLKLYRSIATMDKKAPLPKIAAQRPTWHKAAALARKWQLNQLAGRLEEMASKPLAPGERSPKT